MPTAPFGADNEIMNDITAGDTKIYTFQRRLRSEDGVTPGEIITEVADSVTFKLYCPRNCEAILTKSLGSGITFDEQTATYSITLNSSDTQNLSGRYNFSIRVTTATYEQTIKRGHIDINPICGKGSCGRF